jgi:hypothetical protein
MCAFTYRREKNNGGEAEWQSFFRGAYGKYTHNMPPKKQTTSAPKNPWLKVVKETMKKYPSLPFSEVLKTAKASYRKT